MGRWTWRTLLAVAGCVGVVWLLSGAGRHPQDRPLAALEPDIDRPLRIVAFGTSLTAGNAWPDVLAGTLGTCLARPVTLTRVAQPGAGSAWALTQVGRVAALQPDLVLVEFAINDADLLDGVSLRRSRMQHDRLLGLLKRDVPDARLLLMTMNPAHGMQRLLRARLGAYYLFHEDLARHHDTGLAALSRLWADAPEAHRVAPDGLHPTDAATRAVIVPHLARMIARAAGHDGCTAAPRDDVSR